MRVSHLDRKLAAGSFAEAAWGGLQDSIPRAGIVSLHARVAGVQPDSWEDGSLVQIWFRGGADYIVPRAEVGVFTLGCYPRNEIDALELERLADDVERLTSGQMTDVRAVDEAVGGDRRVLLKRTSATGRVHIRWDASRIWLASTPRPNMDVEDARRELARRFLHWFGPSRVDGLARWTGVPPRDAKATWAAIEGDVVEVEVGGERGFVLAPDVDAIRHARPVEGVRLLPIDDPFTKYDKELLVADPSLRRRVLPGVGESPGYAPGAILLDGVIVGAWQRQQRRFRIHPFRSLSRSIRAAIEAEAVAFPIAGRGAPTVAWEDA